VGDRVADRARTIAFLASWAGTLDRRDPKPVVVAYLLLAQHRFYGERWIKTGLKFVALQTCYIALIIIATLLTVLAPLLMMGQSRTIIIPP
jgi:hypothetical protein